MRTLFPPHKFNESLEVSKMMYRICPFCGSHLDPCEPCDCQRIQAQEKRSQAVNTNSEGARYVQHISKDIPKTTQAGR